ncbi:putative pectinesterase inhibitor domain-containing protein [Arabidopsis thaliana]|uniref:Pectinesterase inhibitor domain-containing protein n=2 Tax=Arabidopsis TaxID=3701 RepID=A0A178USR3_ARATH|nr:Pectinesterase inhibitor domain [Arabidopsis thaliana x Arabidopsis arenosa]OAO96357.1 hypothetical protein AXX17_AT5G45420 [Arabidopsis thaliana]
MKFSLYLVMSFLLLNCFATAQSLIRDSCKKATTKDPKLKYDFCVKSLEENPQSKTAKSLEGLVFVSTKNVVSKTTSLKGMVDKILKEDKYEVERPLLDCLELYTEAIDSLNQSLDTVKSRDYKTATMLMSAAMDAPGSCETKFTKRKKAVKSPFTKENDVLFHMVLIPIALTSMLDMK